MKWKMEAIATAIIFIIFMAGYWFSCITVDRIAAQRHAAALHMEHFVKSAGVPVFMPEDKP
jgi:hypothetical protein